MDDSKPFEIILQHCLDRLEMGGSLQACLRDFPDDAEALAPLLAAADELRWCALPPLPESTYAAVRTRTLAAFAYRPPPVPPRRRAWTWTGLWPRAVVLACALLLIFAGVGISAAAAQQSLPGSLLYSLKRGAEQMRLELAPSPQAQASLYLDFAGRRLDEALAIAASGRAPDPGLLVELAADYGRAQHAIVQLPSSQRGSLLNRYTVAVREHHTSLQKALAHPVAPSARSGLEAALSSSEQAAAWPASLQPQPAPPAAVQATTRSGRLPATAQPSLPASPTPNPAQPSALVQLPGLTVTTPVAVHQSTAIPRALVQQQAVNAARMQASSIKMDGAVTPAPSATARPKQTLDLSRSATASSKSLATKTPPLKPKRKARTTPTRPRGAVVSRPSATAVARQTPSPTPTRSRRVLRSRPLATAVAKQTPSPTSTAAARPQATTAPHLRIKKKARRAPRQALPTASPTPTPDPAQRPSFDPTGIDEQAPSDTSDTPLTDPTPANPRHIKPGKGLQGNPAWSDASTAGGAAISLTEFARPVAEPAMAGAPGKSELPLLVPAPPDVLDTNAGLRGTVLPSIEGSAKRAAGKKAARVQTQRSSRAQKLKLKRTSRP